MVKDPAFGSGPLAPRSRTCCRSWSTSTILG